MIVSLDHIKINSLCWSVLSKLGPIRQEGINIDFKITHPKEAGVECNIAIYASVVIHGARTAKPLSPPFFKEIYDNIYPAAKQQLKAALFNIMGQVSFVTTTPISLSEISSSPTYIWPNYAAGVNSFSWTLRPTNKLLASHGRLCRIEEIEEVIQGPATTELVMGWVKLLNHMSQ